MRPPAAPAPAGPAQACGRAPRFPEVQGPTARAFSLSCWNAERGFRGFSDGKIALPTFVLQLDMLNGYRIGVGIEIREGLVLGDPTAMNVVGNRLLACLVIYLQDDILAEVLQGDF